MSAAIKGAYTALLLAIAVLLLFYLNMDIYTTKTTLDIHVQDTFFILSYTAVAFILFLLLGTFFVLGGLIGSRFESKLFWVLVLLFAIMDLYFVTAF